MPLNQMQRLVVDLAFQMGAEAAPGHTVEEGKAYWYAKEASDVEIKDLRNAVNRHEHHTHGPHVGGGTVDSTARKSADEAHGRLDKLHVI